MASEVEMKCVDENCQDISEFKGERKKNIGRQEKTKQIVLKVEYRKEKKNFTFCHFFMLEIFSRGAF